MDDRRSPAALVASAFSEHRFADAYPHLAPDVRWNQVGGPTLTGREAVVAACKETLAALSGVRTDIRSIRTIDGGDSVVVDALVDYHEPDGVSSVASCDIYDFRDGLVTAITSYTVIPTGGSE